MEPSPSPKRSARTSARTRSPEPLRLDPRALLAPGEPALIGVSGGRDSMALLHALLGRKLVVCHFDHGLRKESAAEAKFVAQWCAEHHLPCEIGQPKSKLSRREAEAREARYAFFAEVAQRTGIKSIYLAHHADDQAETFLFHLLRGSGASGLCGMHPQSRRGDFTLLRPLLGTWRAEIDAYLKKHAIPYHDDASNQNPKHTRNRLRHEIIPALEKTLGRKVRQALWRAAETLQAEDAHLRALTPTLPPGPLDVSAVRALPPALQRRALHAWLRAGGVPDLGFDDVEMTRQLLTQSAPAKVNLSGGWHARRRAGKLFLESP